MTLLTHVFETRFKNRCRGADADRSSHVGCRPQRRPVEDQVVDESPEVTFERLAARIEAMQAQMVQQHRVELARQRIDEGYYDDPRVVDLAVDRLMNALSAVHANA